MKTSAYLVATLLFFGIFGVHSAFALTISPVRIEVAGDPGQTLRGELEMLNEQLESKQFFSSYENFEPSGDTGSPHFIGSENGLATWMNTERMIEIAPNEKKIIPYTITIPKDAEPGGYFSAIFWGGQDPATLESGEVSIGGKLGVLILLRVNGDITEGAGISDFSIDSGGKVFDSVPLGFTYKFTNTGGDRVVPLGNIVIKNMFGGTAVSLPANDSEGNVLPNSSRRFTSIWESRDADNSPQNFFEVVRSQVQNFHLGVYSANLLIVYGATNQSASDSFYFVMFPWQLMLVIFVIVILSFLALKKYNAWIIARSQK